MTNRLFYVYEHWRPDKDVCFYVGKGCGKRAHQMYRGRNKHHLNIQSKLTRLGMCAEVRLVHDGLSEIEAFALEIERIAFWRELGVKLANLTNGGEGISGYVSTKEQRLAISIANKGKKRSPETKALMSRVFKGRVISEETKRKISETNKGMPAAFKGRHHTEETKKILSEKGKIRGAPKHPPEVIEKIAAKHRGMKRSPEACAKISAKAKGRPSHAKGKPSPLKGRKLSPETRAKMSAHQFSMWEKRRAEGFVSPMKGKKHSEESRANMSKASRARTDRGALKIK